MQKFCLFTNPSKASQQLKNRVIRFLSERGLEYLEASEYANNGKEITDILVIGGDGTLNYLINQPGVIDKPIGIIPGGTGNDYVKSLCIGETFAKQLETATSDEVIAVDLGQCNDRYFINGFGLGFDGQIAKSFEENRTILKGHAAYYYHVVRTLAGFEAKWMKFRIDGESFEEKVLLLTIAKGTTFGGGFKLTPHSNLTDGEFAISLIGNLQPLQRFMNIHRLKKGTHDRLREVRFLKGQHIEILEHPDLVAHIDGEVIGTPPFEVKLIPQRLKLRMYQEA